ncbi:MAG: hypothetical protein K2O88_00640 [Paramuribaculum sp.]|nr:hypothetical protein [Paramuribaculum sp.]
MNARETAITQIVKSRPFALLLIITTVVAAITAAATVLHPHTLVQPEMGIIALNGFANGATITVCLALNIIAVIMMSFLNGQYNLLRTTSWLFLAMMIVSQGGNPGMMTHATMGLAGCVALLICIWICFSTYQQPHQTKRVFLLFFIISCMGCCHYAYLAYLPVFFAGIAQMRAISMRSILAALVGIVVPVWLLWSFSIVDFSHLTPPHITITSMTMLKGNPVMSTTLTFTIIAGTMLTAANMVKVYGYNAITRAHNGLMLLVWLITAVLCIFDFSNLWATLPMLNCSTAFQSGLFFRIYTRQRAYLPVTIMIAAYAALYIWTILQPNISM